jgi:prepilin-type N-terminal cleavage/methylation domain-containing protein
MKPKGYTLIEILIVIIIIGIVASIATNTYQRQREVVRYNDSISAVINMIKTARNWAITSRPTYDGSESKVPKEGYGVYIERSTVPGMTRFVLFANTEVTDSGIDQYDAGKDIVEEEYILPKETLLEPLLAVYKPSGPTKETISYVAGYGNENEAVILFRPPQAEVTLAPNFNPLNVSNMVYVDDIYLEFRRRGVHSDVPSTYVHINRVAGFPELL